MEDKKLKKLNRKDLIDLIYYIQTNTDALKNENEIIKKEIKELERLPVSQHQKNVGTEGRLNPEPKEKLDTASQKVIDTYPKVEDEDSDEEYVQVETLFAELDAIADSEDEKEALPVEPVKVSEKIKEPEAEKIIDEAKEPEAEETSKSQVTQQTMTYSDSEALFALLELLVEEPEEPMLEEVQVDDDDDEDDDEDEIISENPDELFAMLEALAAGSDEPLIEESDDEDDDEDEDEIIPEDMMETLEETFGKPEVEEPEEVTEVLEETAKEPEIEESAEIADISEETVEEPEEPEASEITKAPKEPETADAEKVSVAAMRKSAVEKNTIKVETQKDSGELEAIEELLKRLVENTTKQPTENPVDKFVGLLEEIPTEKVIDKIKEKSAELSAEKDKMAEKAKKLARANAKKRALKNAKKAEQNNMPNSDREHTIRDNVSMGVTTVAVLASVGFGFLLGKKKD